MKKDRFDQIYTDYHKLVLHVAFDILQDHSLAQDVCQEVFIKLYQKIEKLDEDKIKGWLLRNTQRRAIDFWRRAYRKNEMPLGKEKLEKASVMDDLLKEESECCRKGFRVFMLDGLKDHNPVWHDLMIRVIVEGEPVREVADEYGMSVASARMKISRARRWLYVNYYRDYRGL